MAGNFCEALKKSAQKKPVKKLVKLQRPIAEIKPMRHVFFQTCQIESFKKDIFWDTRLPWKRAKLFFVLKTANIISSSKKDIKVEIQAA